MKINNKGYVIIQVGMQLVPEHRLIAEQHLGRILEPAEVIHHCDFNKQNNSIDNLALFENQKAHAHWHRQFNQFGLTNPLKRIIEKNKILNLSLKNGYKDLNTSYPIN